ncbi:hypothetical protein H1R20_g16603, partial [Candolleomyces eurysporus]
MRFLWLVSLLATTTSLASVLTDPKPVSQCDLNPKIKGPLLQEKQDAAAKDFAHIFLVEKDPKKAWDKYVPGEYIEHNPFGVSGRENAIAFLTGFIQTPGLTISNLTAYGGGGFGHLHFRETLPGEFDRVVIDRLRFVGTCFVEHWDVAQVVTGEETNPLAWF